MKISDYNNYVLTGSKVAHQHNVENTKIKNWPLIWRKGQSAGCQKWVCVKRQMKKDDLLMSFESLVSLLRSQT